MGQREVGRLKAVQRVRSRLIHPSRAEDLTVTANEVRTLKQALGVYVGMQRAFVREMASEILDARAFARSFIKHADPEVHAEAIARIRRSCQNTTTSPLRVPSRS